MPVAKPGPKPEFDEEFLLKMRPDQRKALDRISFCTGLSRSALIRFGLDYVIIAGTLALHEVFGPKEANGTHG
jgi:hypothetical protein